jgi:outer membrane cobalamin receptor
MTHLPVRRAGFRNGQWARGFALLALPPLLAFADGAAWAQDGPDTVGDMNDLSLERLLDPEITTASRTSEHVTEAPATVYVISKADIHARNYSVLTDVLKDLPGMETVEQYYSEQGTLVPVRGVVGNNKIVLLINGMRVNPPGGEELMMRSDLSVRFAEQIEIIYGPGSTLYGQDAISAVINIKTKKAGEGTGEALAGYGTYQAKEGFASFATRLPGANESGVSVSGFVSMKDSDLSNLRKEFPEWWQKYDDYLGPIGRAGKPTRNDTGFNAFARLEAGKASLQAWYRESSRSSAEGSGEGGKNPVLFFVPESRWRDRSLVVEGQDALSLSKTLVLNSIFTFNRYEVHPESRYVFPNGSGGLYLDDFKYGLGTSTSLEEKFDWTLGPSTRLMFGLVGANYDIVPKASVPGGANPDEDLGAQGGTLSYYTRPGDPTSRVDVQRVIDLHYRSVGAYVEGSYRFTEHLRAIAGLRADISTRYSEKPISPRAALIYNGVDDRLTLKYIFSTAFVAPAPYFGHNVFDNGVQLSIPNHGLEPERAVSNEINASWQSHNLITSLSAYFNHQSDLLITAQSEAPETIANAMVSVDPAGTTSRLLRHSINLGSSNTYGFDLFTKYSFSRLSGWGSYSYVDVKRTLGMSKSGLQQISHHNVRTGFTVEILSNLSLTPSLVFRSTPVDLPATYVDSGVSLDHPWEVNVSALYTPHRMIDVFAIVRNATYHKYALRGVSGPAPQEPFAAMGGIRLRY